MVNFLNIFHGEDFFLYRFDLNIGRDTVERESDTLGQERPGARDHDSHDDETDRRINPENPCG